MSPHEPTHVSIPPAPLDTGYLATKRTPPQLPPRLVARERLLRVLDEAVTRSPITLVRAPAGSGKTALLSEWARSGRAPGPVAWLSLSSTDSHRGRFWRQVFLALSEAQADPALALLAMPSPQAVDRLLITLVTILGRLETPIVLVLDDLHEVTDDQVMSDLAMVLRAPPPGLRLLIATRRDPPLRLQRLRLAGLLSEIDEAELTFTQAETSELFAASGLTVHAPDATLLWNRTEGWAAGLALTVLALRARRDTADFIAEFAGDVAPVADYLLEEVLSELDPGIRDFLLVTSVANTICGDLADALTGRSGSAVLLEQLYHEGVLTTALDDHREWYRYHGLMADLLRSVLRREDPELVPVLRARAARWYGDHDFPVPAARHAAAAGDLGFLTELTATRAFSLLALGEIGELAAVLRELPEETLHDNPVFALALAGAAIEVANVGDATYWTEVALAHADAVPDPYRKTFDLGVAVTRLYQARVAGDIDDALDAARVLISDDDAPLESATDLDALALCNLGALELWIGDPQAARRRLERGRDIAEMRGRRYLQVYALSHLAVERTAWSGDLPGATRAAEEALDLCETYGWLATPRAGAAMTVLSVIAMLEGRLDDAMALVDESLSSMAGGIELPVRANTALHRARLLRMRGRGAEAIDVVAGVRRDLAGTPFLRPLDGPLEMEEALALWSVGRRDEALDLLTTRLERGGAAGEVPVTLAGLILEEDPERALALVGDWIGADRGRQLVSTQVRARITAARAYRELGDRERAFDALERALAQAVPQRRRLPFLEQGPDFSQQLREHVGAGSTHAAFVTELHDRIGRPAGEAEDEPAAHAHPRDELSARELEVLRFLPTMLTNREIAEELMVSVNTVKTHLKQVYTKLGAHDRRDAVRRARDRGLLG